MGKSGKAQAKTQIADYYLSIHYALCRGPVDSINAIAVAEKPVPVFAKTTRQMEQTINMPGLFGGDKEGGGLVGVVETYLGDESQLLTRNTAVRLANTKPGTEVGEFDPVGDPAQLPGFRGIAALVFRGVDTASAVANAFGQSWSDISSAVKGNKSFNGFKWGSNNPNVPTLWTTVTRKPRGLDSNSMIGENANPAHIVFECMTNVDWGMGASPNIFDVDSFLLAAQTLRDEEFGISMQWTAQAKIEDFVSEVLDHISGTIGLDPTSGLFYLKLMRKDYDEDSLRVISPDNATLSSFQRKSWGETINEIVVTYTDPENEQDATVTAHADFNITIQGSIVSDSRNYYGVRDADLAARLAERDVQNAATPLYAAEVLVDHTFWKTKPGDVLGFSWPSKGIQMSYARVAAVTYGVPGSPGIVLSLTEDIFGFADKVYTAPPTQWEDPSSEAVPLPYTRLDTAPYYLLATGLGDQMAQTIEYPECRAMILGGSNESDIKTIDVAALQSDIVGNMRFISVCSVDKQGYGVLSSSLPAEYQSNLFPITNYSGRNPEIGFTVLIEDPVDPSRFEMCAIEELSESSFIVRRGVLDTLPITWLPGALMWVMDPRSTVNDGTSRSDGETVNYKLLPKTSISQLAIENAPVQTVTLSDRIYLPYRPANIKLNGKDEPLTVMLSGADGLDITWARRNRLQETSTVLRWTDGDVLPEEGQTVRIQLLADDLTTVIQDYAGIEGTSFHIPMADFGILLEDATFYVNIFSERDGFQSLSTITRRILVTLSNAGWGIRYGVDYGT